MKRNIKYGHNYLKDLYYYFLVKRLIYRGRVHREFIEFFFRAAGNDKTKNTASKWFRNYLAKLFKKYRHIEQ